MDSEKIEDTNKPVEVVQDSNINILANMDNYLQYIRDNIRQIIIDDQLQYSEPMEVKKIYPAFTYTQFLFLLKRLFDRVYSVNTELLYDSYINKYKKVFNVDKVNLCYEMYDRLCTMYGFTCTIEGFYRLTGIDKNSLQEWLSCGKSNLLIRALENSKNTVLSRFENSNNGLLQLSAANYKYGFSTPINEHTEAASLDVLPDLLALPGDGQKTLTDSEK